LLTCCALSAPQASPKQPHHPRPPPAGPKERLDSTAVSQPAIYVASLAALEKLKAEQGPEAADAADVCCGLSLGEYTALTHAGALSFDDGVRLVKIRGESMQAAADAQPSGMVSVIGLSADKVGWVG
jgi:[acyl-carrier-protein] S-malonyltransferase